MVTVVNPATAPAVGSGVEDAVEPVEAREAVLYSELNVDEDFYGDSDEAPIRRGDLTGKQAKAAYRQLALAAPGNTGSDEAEPEMTE